MAYQKKGASKINKVSQPYLQRRQNLLKNLKHSIEKFENKIEVIIYLTQNEYQSTSKKIPEANPNQTNSNISFHNESKK